MCVHTRALARCVCLCVRCCVHHLTGAATSSFDRIDGSFHFDSLLLLRSSFLKQRKLRPGKEKGNVLSLGFNARASAWRPIQCCSASEDHLMCVAFPPQFQSIKEGIAHKEKNSANDRAF